jgi:uncharacterized membrane protein
MEKNFFKIAKLTWDILVLFIIVFIFLLFHTFGVEGAVRWPFAGIVLLVVPGYSLLCMILPRDDKISPFLRIVFSITISIALIPIQGLILNNKFDLREDTVILSSLSVGLILLTASLIIRLKIKDPFRPPDPSQLWTIAFGRFEKYPKKDRIIAAVIAIMVVVAGGVLISNVIDPDLEPTTDFYILSPERTLNNYTTNFTLGEGTTLWIGLSNHEGKDISYTVEIWYVNFTMDDDLVSVESMLYHGSIHQTLESTDIPVQDDYTSQWEKEFYYEPNKTGEYRIWFFLYLQDIEEGYVSGMDYADTAAIEKVTDAVNGEMSDLYLDINVVAS